MPVYANAAERDEQVYLTQSALADAVVDLARAHAPLDATFVDLGVGEGALFSRLPHPRCGVECRPPSTPLNGVEYNTNALEWTIKDESCCVVMNPPFKRCVDFFNHAASTFGDNEASTPLVIVWIVGCNVRLWTTEDKLHERMELVDEKLVPPAMRKFIVGRAGDVGANGARREVDVKTVVQVWRRREPGYCRPRWNLPPNLPGFQCVYKEPCPRGCLIVSRAAGIAQIGKAGILGLSAHRDSDCHYALTDNARRDLSATLTLGTLRKGFGTALFLAAPTVAAAETVCRRLLDLRIEGHLEDLYRHRTSLTMGCLSIPVLSFLLTHTAHELARPIEYLDGVRRQVRQW